MLAEVEQGRADQVADVLHEEQRAVGRRKCLDGALHHAGVQMAPSTGVHLDGARSGPLDAFRVVGGLLVPFDDADLAGGGEPGDGALQQRGLARAGRAHQVDREDPAYGEPGAHVLGQVVVACQHPLFEHEGVHRRVGVVVAVHLLVIALVEPGHPDALVTPLRHSRRSGT